MLNSNISSPHPLPQQLTDPAKAQAPGFSTAEFRASLGMFATGVTIVTARSANGELVLGTLMRRASLGATARVGWGFPDLLTAQRILIVNPPLHILIKCAKPCEYLFAFFQLTDDGL